MNDKNVCRRTELAKTWALRGMALAALWAATAFGAAADRDGASAPVERDAVIRHVDRENDREALARIRHFRKLLPVEFRKRNNFAWARVEIEGLDKKEFYAHSRIQGLDKMSKREAKRNRDISPLPPKETAQFTTLFVDYMGNIGGPKAIPRHFDTEYKILEDVAARLSDSSAKGSVLLYTDLEPCLSCRGVMKQFLAIYTNVEMTVLYAWP
jgi:hypothetical protein